MKEKYSQFIVVGGGIAGSIAAYVCSRLKRKTIWFCPKKEPLQGAIQIPPNSIKFLKNIGCFDILKKFLNQISLIRVRDQNFKQDLSSINVDQKYFTIDRKSLFLSIKEQIESNTNVKIIDEKIISFSSNDSECRCTSSSGNEYFSNFILGADGATGVIRNNLTFRESKNVEKKYIFRSIIKKNKYNTILFQSAINLWLDDGWHIVYYPFSNGNYLNLILVGKNSISKLEQSNNFELNFLKGIDWQSIELDNSINEIIFNHGRIFLLGDAAHPIQPHLAQGAAQTFFDGSVLLDSLFDNGDDFFNLNKYANLRSKELNKIRDLSFFAGQSFGSKGVMAELRNRLILGSDNYLEEFMSKVWD